MLSELNEITQGAADFFPRECFGMKAGPLALFGLAICKRLTLKPL